MAELQEAIHARYLPEVECSNEGGMSNWGVVVKLYDENGAAQFLSVSPGMISEVKGKTYLAIGVVQVDYSRKRVLVELPSEADSGVNRMWIPFTSFRSEG